MTTDTEKTQDNEKSPDIEIYVHKAKISDIVTWLENTLDTLEPTRTQKQQFHFLATFNGNTFPVLIYERVVKDYTSIWLDCGNTPWHNDSACAHDAFIALDHEIRCIKGSWDNTEDPDLWLSITKKGEETLIWKTE